MKATITFLLTLFIYSATAQSIEQKAIEYLVRNIEELTINYSDGQFPFKADSNKIWYEQFVRNGKSREKVKLKEYTAVSEDHFYKIVHGERDILILTYLGEKKKEHYHVSFRIATYYMNYTNCTVIFDAQEVPVRVRNDGHAAGGTK